MLNAFFPKLLLTLFSPLIMLPAYSQVAKRVSETGLYKNAKAYCSIDVPVAGIATEDKIIYIDPSVGSYAYIILDNYPNNFTVDEIVLKSYKKIAGEYEKLKEETYTISTKNYFTYIKYSFTSTGEYAFDIYDKNGTFIKSAFVTADTKAKTSESSSTSKYKKARVFCSIEVPVYGVAKEAKTLIIDRTNGSYAYIVIDNYPTKFNVDKIVLKAYKKYNGKYEKLKEDTYDIDSGLYFTYIKYSFFTSGEYAFDVYDEDGLFINTAYVNVNYK